MTRRFAMPIGLEDARLSRRQMLQAVSCGFGSMALAGIATQASASGASALSAKRPHVPAKARHVIFLFMQGAPSHVDTFDYKPRLAIDHNKPDPQKTGRKLMKSPWKFSQHGESGRWVSELFPHVAQHVDRLCFLHGLQTPNPNHPQATLMMHTGSVRFVRPSVGSWVLYGLGTENESLPGYIAINPLSTEGGTQNYSSAFLPSDLEATRLGGEGQDLAHARFSYITNPRLNPAEQKQQLQLLESLHRARSSGRNQQSELDHLISNYELAFRMQFAAPGLLNLENETPQTLAKYGVDQPYTSDFGRQCLLARRCVEAGVRFVELTNTGWDHHRNLRYRLTDSCRSVDQPIAALLEDLDQRGLLDETLVIWGGEFGRTPAAESDDGRDHNGQGFTMWMAGAGVKPGISYGATDEHGIAAVEGKMDIHDLHATVLQLLGFDHERLTYRYSGRDFRLTDVRGKVVHDIIA
jgi:hypothetical protein